MFKRWWIVVERLDLNDEYMAPYIVGPYYKRTAKRELQSDSGLIFCLLTVDAKAEQYQAVDCYMTKKRPSPYIPILVN